MKKYLLPKEGNFYKINLHCHTNISDGKLSPEEVKKLYKSLGYSAVAFTDHDVFITHNDLTDDEFIALNGFEMEFADRYECYENPTPWDRVKQCHICLIATNPEIEEQIFYPRDNYVIGNKESKKLVKFNPDHPTYNFERWYDKKCINYVIKTAKENGYYVTYNHPSWSLEEYPEYIAYNGMDAMEIMNSGSINIGNPDYNPTVYDDMLRAGKRISAVASEDNHNSNNEIYSDSGKAWTMIKAEKLDYSSIFKALYAGNLYASEGPEIYELYVEDGILTVKCSNAQKIKVNYEARKAQIKLIEDGTPLTEAQFELSKEHGCFRITVVGLDGKTAYTSAYYPDELGLL